MYVAVGAVGLVIVRDSHELVAPLLLESPLYTASQPYDPGTLNCCDGELGTTPLVTVTADPTSVALPEHVEELKYSYWTVPPALLVSPLRVAESVTEPPAPTLEVERVVEMLGLTLPTVKGSHALVAPI